MQYPEIQFYRGSLVRLASGKLKQVEDLSSDDFLESARLAAAASRADPAHSKLPPLPPQTAGHHHNHNHHHNLRLEPDYCNSGQRTRFDFNPLTARHRLQAAAGSSGTLDENNNSVFNSPEPTSAFDDSPPRMETDEDADEEIDVELDVVSHEDHNDDPHSHHNNNHNHNNHRTGHTTSQGPARLAHLAAAGPASSASAPVESRPADGGDALPHDPRLGFHSHPDEPDEFYIDSSVVRDFLEVGPIQAHTAGAQTTGQQPTSPASTSSGSSSLSGRDQQQRQRDQAHRRRNQPPAFTLTAPVAAATGAPSSGRTSSSSSLSPSSPPVVISQPCPSLSQTVLVKFFLEASRSVAFIEVPIEHPFFVLHRGWSSYNPQRTYDKFGLKCRKLKIGDTCISLIRRRSSASKKFQQEESDHCNVMFSSININE